MLDAHAHGEGLRLDVHAAIVEHLERIAGAVANGEHHMIGGDAFAGLEHDAPHPARAVVGDIDVDDLGLEAILTA